MTIQIISGSIDLLEDLVKLDTQIFQGMYNHPPYSLDTYKNKLAGVKPIIFVAKNDELLVGDSISFQRESSFYIWILGVLPAYRDRGIASKLLDLNEQHAKTQGLNSVTAKVYNVSKQMQRLLIARGYHATEITPSQTDTKWNAVHFKLNV